MYNRAYCKWLLMTCLLGSAAIGCAPWVIAVPRARVPRAVAIEPPSPRAGYRLDQPTRSADEPAPDDPGRLEPAAGERASSEPADDGERDPAGAGKRDAPGAGKSDAPDTGESDAPDAGKRGKSDAPDTGKRGKSDAPGAGKRGKSDAPDTGEIDAPDTGEIDAPDAGKRGKSDAPGAGKRGKHDAAGAGKRGKHDAAGAGKRGKRDVSDTGERDASDPGERDASDIGERDASDTGDAVLFPAAQVGVQSNPARVAFEFFVGKGLTSEQAAGIVGNLMQESGVDPAARQSDGPGHGIAQWSAGGRWNNLLRFAKARRASPLALTTQLEFLWHELTTVPAYGLGALRAARSVVAATRVFEKSFEVCGACNEPRRIAMAQAVLRVHGNRAARRRA
jgi:hypothetical protein